MALSPKTQRILFGGRWSPKKFGFALAAWYESALSALWQDSARTTRATADSDPDGSWDDISGRGRHLIQATTTQRGTLKLAIQNGRPAIRFDGVDDFLGVAVGGGALNQPAWEFVAFKMVTISGAANQTVIDGGAQNESRLHVAASGSQIAMFAGTTLADVVAITAGPVYVVACRFNGASSSLQVNNRTVVSGNAGASAVTGLRTGGDGAQFVNADVLERFRIQTDLSAADVARARNYLNAKYSAY